MNMVKPLKWLILANSIAHGLNRGLFVKCIVENGLNHLISLPALVFLDHNRNVTDNFPLIVFI